MHEPSSGLASGQESKAFDHDSWSVTVQPNTDADLSAKISVRQPLRSIRLRNAASSVAALFLIAVVFTAFCMKLRSRVSEAGLPPRRLAEVGGGEEGEDDDELGSILGACLAYEQEASRLPGATLPPDIGAPSLATSQAGLIASPHGTEPAGPLWPSSAPHWPVPLPRPPHGNPPAEPLQQFPLLSGEGVGADFPPSEGASSASFSFGDSEWGETYPQLDPEAWLDQIPELDPEAWLDKTPDSMGSVVEAPSTGSDGEGSPKDNAQPSTLAATEEDSSGDTTQEGELANHPYVRLPPLRPGVVTRTIRVHDVVTGPLEVNAGSSYDMLSAMRMLLAKPELGPTDADALLQVVELILDYVHNRITPEVRQRPLSELVCRLGNYFLFFDAVLAAHQILGPAMQIETWWNEFESSFRIEYPELEDSMVPLGEKATTLQNFVLARRLQNALRQFKERRRPSNEEIIDIKRQLYFAKSYFFRHARWDPWREDDKAHQSQQDASRKSQDQGHDYQG